MGPERGDRDASGEEVRTALLRPAMLAIAAIALAVGLAVQFAGVPASPASFGSAGSFRCWRRCSPRSSPACAGEVGLDVVAALSMGASLAFGAPLAGIVVALMYSGGQYLEAFAEGQARREMTALLGRVARTAMLVRDGALEETPIDAIRPGRLLIRPGEVVPVDGIAADPPSSTNRPDGRVAAGRAPRRC